MEDIINLLKTSYKKNWITPRDGNVSHKRASENFFTITPSGLRKHELKVTDFIQIAINKDRWEQLNNFNLKPSGEIELHYEIMKCVDKELFVVHLHPTNIISIMYSGINLLDLAREFPELSRYTKVANNTDLVPPLSINLAEQCKENLSFNNKTGYFDYDIVGIPNHGIVSIGSTIYDAFEHVERLEHISQIVLSSKKIS